MSDWLAALPRLLDEFPRGTGGFMAMTLVATVAFVVFLAVYAHGMRPESVEKCKDNTD